MTSLKGTSALKEFAAFEGLDPQRDEIWIRGAQGRPRNMYTSGASGSRQRCTSVARHASSQESTSGTLETLSL